MSEETIRKAGDAGEPAPKPGARRGEAGDGERSRQRLGRGLKSLIGPGTPRPVAGLQPAPPAVAPERHLAIDEIVPNPNNPRRRFDKEELTDLARSIRQHGVVQPLLVRPAPSGSGPFEIVAGERRWRAARRAGLETVPVVVREIDDRQSLEIAIIENVQRTDLNAIEEALGYERLIDEHGYTQNDLGEILGKSRSHIANTLRLLKLPEDVRQMVTEGTLSAGAARAVILADDPGALARRIVGDGLTVREAEELAREEAPEPEAVSEARPRPARPATPEVEELEARFGRVLGLKAGLKAGARRAKLTIEARDLEELRRICERLERP